jgi:hypothetical protein
VTMYVRYRSNLWEATAETRRVREDRERFWRSLRKRIEHGRR